MERFIKITSVEGASYLLVPNLVTQKPFHNPLSGIPTSLAMVGGSTFLLLLLQNYSLKELLQMIVEATRTVQTEVIRHFSPESFPLDSQILLPQLQPPKSPPSTSTSTSTSDTLSAARDGVVESSVTRQETVHLPQGSKTVSDVFEGDTFEANTPKSSTPSPDSWQMVSSGTQSTGSGLSEEEDAPDTSSLSARLNSIMQQRSQRNTQDPAAVHPATFGFRKEENWDDVDDLRQKKYHQAHVHPIFYGAQWAEGPTRSYQEMSRSNAKSNTHTTASTSTNANKYSHRSMESSWVGVSKEGSSSPESDTVYSNT
eukprot:m.14761 g.14761  ORF g.14761 m.14761 type:complete len:313 (-) comp10278_c0_seq1:102-1040(-)